MWTNRQLKTLEHGYRNGYTHAKLSYLTGMSINQVRYMVYTCGFKRKYQSLEDGNIGHLDIEASQLTANFGFMLSWCIKTQSGVIVGDKLNRSDFAQRDRIHTDKRIVKSLVHTMREFDVITHFFGDYFDVPFIRSRCLKHRLKFPEYGSIYTVDVWRWCKRNLKLHSNRLESVADHLGVSSKTKLNPNTWIRGTMGDLKAIKEIYEHNRQDVITLEKVYNILKPYSSGARRSI